LEQSLHSVPHAGVDAISRRSITGSSPYCSSFPRNVNAGRAKFLSGKTIMDSGSLGAVLPETVARHVALQRQRTHKSPEMSCRTTMQSLLSIAEDGGFTGFVAPDI